MLRPLVLVLLWTAACSGSSSDDGGATSADGGHSSDAAVTSTNDFGTYSAGNPDGKCAAGIPTKGVAADTSHPTSVVGTGTAASCTFIALAAAVKAGGIITFDCGTAPLTIAVTATLTLPSTKDSVIDGGGVITLDGQGTTQILKFDSANFKANDHGFTVQHITFTNGKIAGSDPIPSPPPQPACSQGFDSGEGGAIYVRDGYLAVIDSVFTNNEAGLVGPDIGGGAIRMLGSKGGLLVVGSTFAHNRAANGGAIGCLFSELDIYDSVFDSNVATGHDANNAGTATQCSQMNNGQNELGSGGNGGAMYSDGAAGASVVLCGDKIVTNNAGTNAFGGGLFFTSNDYSGTLTITDTTMTGNTGGHWTQVQTGSTDNAGTAVGTNAKSLTITSSTLQGVP